MRLDDENESSNVEDRRGASGGMGRGSLGIGGLVLALGLASLLITVQVERVVL